MLFKKHTAEERRELILHGNILNTLLFLSAPTLMVGVVQALVPLSDGLFLNNLAGVVVASAVSFSQPVLNIMVALSQGLGVAAMAMIGQLYGKGSMRAVKEVALQVFVFGFFIGVILMPVCVGSGYFISKTLTSEIKNEVFIYISLYSLPMPFVFLTAIYNSVKNAVGRPEVTFIRIFILLILKIIFNTIFLYFFKMGIVGAVMATLFSYISITVWMWHDLFIKNSDMKLSLKKYHIKLPIVARLFKIGFPSMLSYMLIQLGFVLINREIDKYGAVSLNAQGIASNINSICFILPSAIGTTVTTMISMNIGIGEIGKSKKIFKYGYITSIVIALLTIISVVPFAESFTILFTRNRQVLEIANNALNIYTYSVVSFGVFSICQGVFIALGRTKVPLVMAILRIWLFRYLFILFTQKYLGIYAVFWGNLFSNTIAASLFFYLVKTLNWNINMAKVPKGKIFKN
ncbi:MAG: MATE family efflux transporter [Leptotrichiaceae bacterium]|nr:MATE family efflux transporter [Leptotrichiaceae bacterium]